jgi:tetratricopeptide (TPR) repeat protein
MRTGIAFLLLASAAIAQGVEEVAQRYLAEEEAAFGHYRRKEFGKAVAAFERQIAIFPQNPRPYYNIACCYALEGDAARAGTWLTLSIERGWRDARHLAEDGDFDLVRQSPEYIAGLATLKRARDLDPDPMPRIVPAPAAPSLRTAISASQIQEAAVRGMRRLYEQHEFRKRLFGVYDLRMAVLARYIMENGDALDAADAAAARVATAALYMAEAEGRGEPDRELREVGARYVLRTVEEFLRGYPGDPRLSGVLLARAVALETLGRDAEAIALLRTIRADHPAAAPNAEVQLCALLPAGDELKEVYAALKARYGDEERGLMRARLLCEGMPDLLDLDAAVAARVAAHEGLVAYVFVAAGDTESERLLKALPEASARFLPVVVCVDEDAADLESWLAEHGRSFPAIPRGAAAIDRVWLREVPAVVVAKKDGTVVAVNPDLPQLARLAASP